MNRETQTQIIEAVQGVAPQLEKVTKTDDVIKFSTRKLNGDGVNAICHAMAEMNISNEDWSMYRSGPWLKISVSVKEVVV